MPSPLPPLPLIDGCLFIDNSGWIESMSTCHRLLEYKQLFKRISSAEKPALNFGSAVHSALEYRYVKAQNQRVEPWIDDEVNDVLKGEFDQHPVPEGDWRTLNWAVEVFRRYNQRYSIEEFNLLKYNTPIECPKCEGKGHTSTLTPDGGHVVPCKWCNETGKRELMVEMSYALPLFTWSGFLDSDGIDQDFKVTIPVFYTGRIDLPLSLDSKIFILDHKTTSLLGPMFFDRMRMSAQQRGYCWAFEQLTGQKVSGYIVNAVRTKEPPQYVTNNTVTKTGKKQSSESWWEESLQRERFYLTSNDLSEWKSNAIAKVEEFFWHYQRGYMPMNTENCTKWGRCPYYDVCSLAGEDRGVMLSSGLYTTNVWSPLKEPSQAKI